jgi:hypothetical protein
MRALIDSSEIEFKACFPNGTWLGFGLGGYKMTNTELVFFMAPTQKNLHRVVSTRMTGAKKSTRPDNLEVDSPIYTTQVSSCGKDMVQFISRRPLDPRGNSLAQGHEEILKIGEPIKMIVAGSYVEFDSFYNKQTPSHTK